MKTRVIVAVAVLGVLAWGIGPAVWAEKPAAPAQPTAMNEPIYVCPACHSMALKAGKCSGCEKNLVAMHLLGVKDGQAMFCSCGAGCKCGAAGMKDGKCACGKDVVKVSAKGWYYADDQGCPQLSDKPGKCMCGKKLRKIE